MMMTYTVDWLITVRVPGVLGQLFGLGHGGQVSHIHIMSSNRTGLEAKNDLQYYNTTE